MLRLWSKAVPPPSVPSTAMEVYLANRPVTALEPSTFATRRVKLPSPSSLQPDEVIVRVLFVSADPAMRAWLRSRSYVRPVGIGERMRALGVGRIVAVGSGTRLRVGMLVEGMTGWTTHAVLQSTEVGEVRLTGGLKASAALGVLGITGMTAYFGLFDVGQVRKGDVVVVSAAAGATGSVVAQLANKVAGAHVVGIAGGAEKCAFVRDVLGVEAVDYKASDGVDSGLSRVLGKRRIDVYFDNVGGETLEAALRRLNFGARVVVCGAISGYNLDKLPPGPRNYLSLIPSHARMEGFLLHDYTKRFGEAKRKLGRWVADGKIVAKEDVVCGLHRAPEALQRLFDGRNVGKVVVKVKEDGAEETMDETIGSESQATAKL